jgi:hypothetical protein
MITKISDYISEHFQNSYTPTILILLELIQYYSTFLSSVDRASLYNLVNKAKLVHNFFLVYLFLLYLPSSTCFGQLCAHRQEKQLYSIFNQSNTSLLSDNCIRLHVSATVSHHQAFFVTSYIVWTGDRKGLMMAHCGRNM